MLFEFAVDKFSLSVTDRKVELMTDRELIDLMGRVLLYDIELYPNYFLAAFQSFDTGKCYYLESPVDTHKLQWMLKSFCLVTFNGTEYDIPISRLACTGASLPTLIEASNAIIRDGLRSWQFEEAYNLPDANINHVDLIEVAPLQGSLKLYAGRLHCQRMQDLPFNPNKPLAPNQIIKLRSYCFNDLESADLLTRELSPQLELRAALKEQYRVDVRSKSDAQIAEHVICAELERIKGCRPKRPTIAEGTVYHYQTPAWVSYQSDTLARMLATVQAAKFIVSEDGSVQMPQEIAELKICLGKGVYQMGIGGLHSTEKKTAHIADESTLLIDRDVASYYPSIILNEKLYPQHLGPEFLEVYGRIVARRLAAKKSGDKVTADSLKITINGSFGKLGSKWSALYSPDLMLQVTITGQLALLMLIEMIEGASIPVVSANTDGVLIKCPQSREVELGKIVGAWERLTGFTTEETRYKAVYSRDVNNYLAIKTDGKSKGKGIFAADSLQKNPETTICKEAVREFLANGTPIEQTIRQCGDVRKFLSIRNVKGGAVKSGIYLGKTIRWYYSTSMRGQIDYASSGNKVPNSDGAMPLMELPTELPGDIDYERYCQIARDILTDLGF